MDTLHLPTSTRCCASRPHHHPHSCSQDDAAPRLALTRAARTLAAAAAAAVLLVGCPSAALAELQTVPADQMTQMARPLAKQPTNKGRIWLLIVLGAASLFGTTVVLENNGAWFPAISRANRAMRTSAKKKDDDQASRRGREQGGRGRMA